MLLLDEKNIYICMYRIPNQITTTKRNATLEQRPQIKHASIVLGVQLATEVHATTVSLESNKKLPATSSTLFQDGRRRRCCPCRYPLPLARAHNPSSNSDRIVVSRPMGRLCCLRIFHSFLLLLLLLLLLLFWFQGEGKLSFSFNFICCGCRCRRWILGFLLDVFSFLRAIHLYF